MGRVDEVMDVLMSRCRCIMIPILHKLRIHERWENPDVGARGPKSLLENCHDVGIVLAVPAGLKAELRRQH
jgi:hypothetical protein